MSNLPPISFRPGAPQPQQYTSTFNPIPTFPGQNFNQGRAMPNPAYGAPNYNAQPSSFPGQNSSFGFPGQFGPNMGAFGQQQAPPQTHRNTMMAKSALNFNQVDRNSMTHLANL